MRKVNKILMATVSILLCLVLITTSVLSGIFAKYVITKKGSAAATLKKFGVTLDMDVDDEALEGAGADVETAEDFYKVTKSVTITGLKMAPGVELDKIINIKLSGTPTVNCRFKLDIDFDFDTEKFIIPQGECGVTGDNGYLHFPVKLSFRRPNGNNDYYVANYKFNSDFPDLNEVHETQLYGSLMLHHPTLYPNSGIYFNGIGGFDAEQNKYIDAHLYRDFVAGEEIFLHPSKFVRPDPENETFIYEADTTFSFNEFDLGLNWPEEPSATSDELFDAYIVNNNPDGLGFTYKVTVSVEQIIPE